MTGVVLALVQCLCCRATFACNPVRVPSKDLGDGQGRQPICRACMDLINRKRVEQGLAPFPIAPDAYEAVDEGELP